MPDAKFESASLSIFGDMTLQNLPQVIEFGYLPPEYGFNLKKLVLCPESFFSTQN